MKCIFTNYCLVYSSACLRLEGHYEDNAFLILTLGKDRLSLPCSAVRVVRDIP